MRLWREASPSNPDNGNISIIRKFGHSAAQRRSKVLRHKDPSLPPRRPDPRPQKESAKQWRKPYIYTPTDVRQMLDITRSYPSQWAPLRAPSIHARLLLAYCAGLRRGELARLDLGDVDFFRGTITCF